MCDVGVGVSVCVVCEDGVCVRVCVCVSACVEALVEYYHHCVYGVEHEYHAEFDACMCCVCVRVCAVWASCLCVVVWCVRCDVWACDDVCVRRTRR